MRKSNNINTFDDRGFDPDNFLDENYYKELCTKIDNVTTGIKQGSGVQLINKQSVDITQIENDNFWQEFVAMFSPKNVYKQLQICAKYVASLQN